jgi:hypothetical protein
MTFAEVYGLKLGDSIRVPFFPTELTKHHAVFLVDVNGQELFAENVWLKGVQLITAADFFAGFKGRFYIDRFEGDDLQRQAVVQRIVHRIGTPYHLLNYNCEHFVNEVKYGRVESVQVKNAAALLLVGCLVGLAINKD